MTTDDALRAWHFGQLQRSLRALATSGSEQLALFPDASATANDLAFTYEHWARVIRDEYGGDLAAEQTASLAAIDQRLTMISRDGAEFDPELWTDRGLRSSEQWALMRRLAAAALAAFGWPQGDGDRPDPPDLEPTFTP